MSTTLLVTIAFVLFVLVIFQLARTSEYVAHLRGQEKAEEDSDKINGRIFLVFGIVGMIALVWSIYHYMPYMNLHAASKHGEDLDSMFNVTLFFTGIVFVATQLMLCYFVWKYKHSKERRAVYYPENNQLEMWWTIIPAIVLTGLVIIGIYRWFQITGPEPPGSMVVEVTGQQFSWNFRYPGKDGELGNQEFDYIDGINKVGIDFNDKAALDDFMSPLPEMHVVVDKPVLLRIRSKDVIHDVGIEYFRVKMDAVPGLITRFWFIPTVTTAEMSKRNNNPDFTYEMACDQLCGKSHFSMRATVVVETQQQFDEWAAKQKSFYEANVKGTDEEKNFAQLTQKLKKKKEDEAAKEAAHSEGVE